MRAFHLQRLADETGVSGTGRVAEGVIFEDGTCALRWLSEHRSTATYANLDDVKAIHGHGGKTLIVLAPAEADRCLGCGHPIVDHWGDGCSSCMFFGVTAKNPENQPSGCMCALMNHPEFTAHLVPPRKQ